MEIDNALEKVNQGEVVAIELPAPPGWKKKFAPKKGGTPRRNEIVFIAPTGEEIKTKKQLELYLKSHPDGLSTSDFDWGTGETPRRSARLSGKTKATESPESEAPKKKQRKSIPKRGAKGKNDGDDGQADGDEGGQAGDENKGAADDTMGAAEETKISAEVPKADATQDGDGLVVAEKVLPDKDDAVEAEQQINEEKIAAEELGGDENMDVKLETTAAENINKDQVEIQEASKKSPNAKTEAEDKSLPFSEHNDTEKEAESAPAVPEVREAASAGQVSDAQEDSTSKLGDAGAPEPVTSVVGHEKFNEKASVEKVDSADDGSSKKDEAANTEETQLPKQEANIGNQYV